MNSIVKMLLIASRKDHRGSATLAFFADTLPQLVSHASANPAHMNTQANLLQPLC